MITSRANQKLKNVKKLLDSSRARKEQGVFVVEGERIVSEIPHEMIRELYVSEDNREIKEGQYETVSRDVFKSLSDTVNPQGILAVVKMPEYSISDMLKHNNGKKLIVILDGIRDPGNLGTIMRTAEAAGVNGIIMSRDCVDIYNPKVVRSTMGSIFRVPFISADLIHILPELKANGFSIYGTSLEAERSYKEISYNNNAAVVTGSEANGISREVLDLVTESIKIPMKGRVESLNAAVSLAVVLFHIM